MIFENQNFPKFSFALQYIKNRTEIVPEKNIVSLKKTLKSFLIVGPTVEDFNSL